MNQKQTANDNSPINTSAFTALQLPTLEGKNLCLFDIKQLADKEAAYKAECLQAIKEYKIWERKMSDETDLIEILYGTMEGNIYREKMENMIQLYWAVRKHFRSAFTSYLAQVGAYTTPIRMAA